MKVYFGWPKQGLPKGHALAIGVFDGMHRGHLAILKRAKAVVTFDSMPERVIAPDYAPPALGSLEQKLEWLRQAGIKSAVVLRFDRRFAAQTPGEFAQHLTTLGPREIIVGADFVFGARAAGDAEFLRHRGFKVHVVRPVLASGRPVSSTRIRSAVLGGHMAEAKRLLGRPFTLRGTVVRGARLGTKLGYPTANLAMETEVRPKAGVWGGRVRVLPSTAWKPMLANLGYRPTLGEKAYLTELHLLDFSGDLYGRSLEFELTQFIRPEQRFEGLEQLKQQIRLDEVRFRRSRAFLSASRNSGARLGQRRF
jgi:riboflavin kinase/FMN adenylyltransferase